MALDFGGDTNPGIKKKIIASVTSKAVMSTKVASVLRKEVILM